MLPIVTSNQRFAVTTTTGCGDMIQDGITPPQSTKLALETEVTTPRLAHFEQRRPPCGGIVGHLRIELATPVNRMR